MIFILESITFSYSFMFDELLSILEKRFLENENRHLGIKWSEILQKLIENHDKDSLQTNSTYKQAIIILA